MDQILLSVCCPPQNERMDIKKVANSHVRVTLKRRQKRPKIHVLFLLRLFLVLLRHTFFVQAVSRELLQTPAMTRRFNFCEIG